MTWITACILVGMEWKDIIFSRIHQMREIYVKIMALSLLLDRIYIRMEYIEEKMQERLIKTLENAVKRIIWNIMEQKSSSDNNFFTEVSKGNPLL